MKHQTIFKGEINQLKQHIADIKFNAKSLTLVNWRKKGICKQNIENTKD